jgi:hypothetical protein
MAVELEMAVVWCMAPVSRRRRSSQACATIGTRIVCGYGLGDFTEAERDRLPRYDGPVDPAIIIGGPFDPANPRRILRASAGG